MLKASHHGSRWRQQRCQEKKSSAVGGGPLGEWWRLTVCSADPTVPHQSGTTAVIRAHRCVSRELVRGAAPGRRLCAATRCGRCPSPHQPADGVYFTNQFTPARERERWHALRPAGRPLLLCSTIHSTYLPAYHKVFGYSVRILGVVRLASPASQRCLRPI